MRRGLWRRWGTYNQFMFMARFNARGGLYAPIGPRHTLTAMLAVAFARRSASAVRRGHGPFASTRHLS